MKAMPQTELTHTEPTPTEQAVSAAVGVYPWSPDQRDGTYCNPVIDADYSDPDVIRDGDDFYMTASSFNCTPGLPILHSRDLVNWRLINHAIKNLPHPRFSQVQHGCGVWAPAIRKHGGKFWVFFPMPDEGIYVTTAADPAGEWSPPHLLLEGKGLIDPCPLWDDDGKAYLVHAYANSRSGIKHRLDVRPMAPDASHMLGEGRMVYLDPDKHPTLEGPKIHKKNGYYYISAPAGGVPTGWQVIFRSRDVYGPYEDKIVLAQGGTPINGPHQGAIVDTPTGEWWFIHFQDRDVYGRIIHLQPVEWVDDWPLMGVNRSPDGVGEPVLRFRKPAVNGPVPIVTPQTSDEFDGDRLGLQWQWHANHEDDWCSLSARPGYLRLRALPNHDFAQMPHLLLQKFPARAFTAETRIELSANADSVQAGLIIMGLDHAAAVIQHDRQGAQLVLIVNNQAIESHPLQEPAARLRVTVEDGGRCTFVFAGGDGPFQPLGEPFTAREGHWIGAKVGVFARVSDALAEPAHADVAYFRFGAP